MPVNLIENKIIKVIRETLEELELFHGTTADFDHFDEAYMLTGWGEQSHGYGFYLTTAYDTAKAYSRGGRVVKVEVPNGKYLSYKSISYKEKQRIANMFFKWYTTEHEYGRVAYPDDETRKEFWDDTIRTILDSMDGGDIYGNIAATLGDDKETSEFLNRIGYKGIKFSNVNTDTGKRFWNYVIFNHKDIKILEKDVQAPTEN